MENEQDKPINYAIMGLDEIDHDPIPRYKPKANRKKTNQKRGSAARDFIGNGFENFINAL